MFTFGGIRYKSGKPYSEACDQNREPILAVIRRLFPPSGRVLEIGSGTGQHAVFFAAALPDLIWQTSDLPERHAGIHAWLKDNDLPNARPPVSLDVTGTWPACCFDAVFSANTAHILHWPQVESMFRGVGRVLRNSGIFALYGPFNYRGCYSSESNRQFDERLKSSDPESGVRDFEKLQVLAERNGLTLVEDVPMPVNNRTLVWRKS